MGLVLVLLSAAVLLGSSLVQAPARVLTTAAQVSVNASSFDYPQDVAISAAQYVKGQPGTVVLTVYGMPDAAGSARIYAQLTDQTASPVNFAGGATVLVAITRDGQRWDQLSLTRPVVTRLAPGQQATLQTTITLGGAGHYDLSAALGSPDQP